ncbi:(Fe-S)-binding protein [Acetoanaerobium noterae]|uniref:(Fe-S)-binding protein n=1 Tax=Acetoanaerobium noterae TaxID=745369 RepID=UPI00333ED3ED
MGKLLESIMLDFIEPCTADFNRVKFHAIFDKDISEIFPYLNAQMKSAIYNVSSNSLTFKKEFRLITLHPTKLSVSKAINEFDAYEIMDMVMELVNSTYDSMSNITPLYERRANPSTIEVYKYLPKTNCKSCGCATCLSFAAKMIAGEYKINHCKTIFIEGYEEQKEKLLDMAQTFGWD